jgi:4-hydroxybenzoate polyprenyltransferase
MIEPKKPLKKLSAFLKLIRMNNLLIIVFTQYMASIFLIGPKENWHLYLLDMRQFLIVFSTVCVAAAGYIINDYFDIKIDLINKPEGVIIGRIIRRRWAILIHQVLNFIGLLIGLFLSWKVFFINIISVVTLWFYSERYKKQAFIGNILVAILTAFSLLILMVYYQKNTLLIAIYALFAFSITLIREVIKDMEDIRGDAKYGCRTLPIIWGFRRTKILLYFYIIIFVLILNMMALSLRNHYLIYLFSGSILPFGWFLYALYKADKKRDFAFLSRVSKIIMIIGILTMVLV